MSYANLSSGKQSATYTSHCKAIRMQLYNRRQWKSRLKDPRTSNVETQTKTNARGLGIGRVLGQESHVGLD